MSAYLKYIGAGSIPDIPARDLTKEEAGLHGIERLLASGLYERADKPKEIEPQKPKRSKKDEVNND